MQALVGEALTTSQIEGETLDRASVQSSVRRELGLAADRRRVRPAERGVAEMMVDVYRTFAEPLNDDTLVRWQSMLLAGRADPRDRGRYRTEGDPMQIVSGPVGGDRVHFEAPPSKRVAGEMKRFHRWFSRTGPDGSEPLPALTRAGIGHLYFESIHPFEDGNGRIGRAVAEKAIAQTIGRAAVSRLATAMLARRRDYYRALEVGSQDLEITPWLEWFADTALEAQRRIADLVEFLVAKARLLDRLRGRLNPRQEKALLRMLREGPDGLAGGLSAGNYMTITGASPATATRDLAGLVGKGALVRTGERRHARYELAM